MQRNNIFIIKNPQCFLKRICLTVFVNFAVLLSAETSLDQPLSRHPASSIKITVHRGANNVAPENTIAAAEQCYIWGLSTVEVDVRTSKDGVLYLMHDSTVDRTTDGTGSIVNLTSRQINTLDAGSWFSSDFEGEHVPTLRSMMQWAKSRDMELYLDIKNANISDIIKLVTQEEMTEHIFCNGSSNILMHLNENAPAIKTKKSVTSIDELNAAYETYAIDIIEVHLPYLTSALVKRAHQLGIEVMAWALSSNYTDYCAEYTATLEIGPDRINLNRPDVFVEIEGDYFETLENNDTDSISYWTGDAPEGSFDSNTGWDKTAPGSGDTVVIGKDGQVTCSGVHEIENLEVGSSTDLGGYDSSGPGTLIMTDGALSITGEEHCTIGSGDTGHVIQSGGTLFFAGNDYEIGEYVNGCGTHTMTGGELRIGYWAQDPDFTGGWFMTNDNSAGDDLAIGRERKLDDQGNPQVARGYLTMSGDSVVRVANDAYIPDVGYAELSMTDQALIHVGDDLRSASADNGEGSITMSGDSNLKVEARFTVGDSNGSSVTMTMSDNALVEVGRYMTVAGKDSLGEAGVATLTIEDEATINVGAFLYRGDVGGDPGVTGDDIPTADRVADDQKMYIGAGSEGDGNGTVYQTGSGSFVSIGRELQIGYSSPGQYYLSGGSLVVRGDGPVSGIDFPSGLTSDSGYTDGGGDLIIGYEASGVGLLSIEGGDPNIVRDCTVGLAGEGMLRVKGSDSKITIGGDLGFGGDYLESEGGHGMLDIVLTGSSQSLIDVVGGAEDGTIHGDLHLYDAYLTAGFDGYRPASGDYSSDPLEWLIIRYAGIRTTSEVFALSSSLSDGSANGAIWSVRYDDTAGEIFLQITKVFMTGDADCDGDIDVSDLSTLTEHWLSSEDTVQWSDGDFNDDGTINLLDFEKLAQNWMQL